VTAPRRAVVRGPNWLGDLVMAAPAIRTVADAWPDAVVDVAVPAGLAPVVAVLDPRTAAVPLEGRMGVGAVRRHAEQLRAGRYDVALLLTNSFGSALAMQQAGVPERWGYRRDGRGPLLTRAIRVRDARRESRHHADYYAALLEAVGLPRPPLALQALLPRTARDEALALLRQGGWDGSAPVLACAPGAAYGAALLGHVAAGTFADVDEATSVVRTLDEVTEPDARRVEIYDEIHAVYRSLYSTLREDMHRLTELASA